MEKDFESYWFDMVEWGVLLGVSVGFKSEADIKLYLVGKAEVAGPQCHECLNN